MKLPPPDIHYLNAAQGWLELGDSVESLAELEKVAPAFQQSPEVLEIRWQIHAREHRWEQCVTCADTLVKSAHEQLQGWIHRSFALHELRRTQEAYDALLPAVVKFPKDWLIQYNLACYCCRMKDFQRALRYLEKACKLGNPVEVKAMALKDSDLLEVRNLLP
jgi:tetratricopeptide (TPR) repeat protein